MTIPPELLLSQRRDIYEPVARYVPNFPDFRDPLIALLPQDWTVKRDRIWLHCSSRCCASLPLQGWKIHISSRLEDAAVVLSRVAAAAVSSNTAFKCAQDRRTLSLVNSKRWSRGAFGKFITCYPASLAAFEDLISLLASKLEHFSGPHILSDKQFGPSGVVFYRYGAIRSQWQIQVDGTSIPVIYTPEGATFHDRRQPFFTTPPWVNDPFPDLSESSLQVDNLLNERFIPHTALHFTASGGVYLASDLQSSSTVVLKESRPHVLSGLDKDCADLLLHEFHILSRISHLHIAPEPLSFFTEWRHTFLAETYVNGISLRNVITGNPLILSRPRDSDYAMFAELLKNLFLGLVSNVTGLHDAGVIHGDLSHNNVIFDQTTKTVSLIDFESSWLYETERPTYARTPGFSLPDERRRRLSPHLNDWFGVASIILNCMFPVVPMFEIAPGKRKEWTTEIVSRLRLHMSLAELLSAIFECEIVPSADEVLSAFSGPQLQRPSVSSAPKYVPGRSRDGSADHATLRSSVLESLLEHILEEIDCEDDEVIAPSSLDGFTSNPVSLSTGSAGIAYALLQLTGRAPDNLLAWTERAYKRGRELPPGLMRGIAGIALLFQLCGRDCLAQTLLSKASASPLLQEHVGLFYGISGVGLANACSFESTGRVHYHYLAEAERIAWCLVDALERAKASPSAAPRGIGLGHGLAGCALYLLYMFRLTGEKAYLERGEQALDLELKYAVEEIDGGLTFPKSLDHQNMTDPYLEYGNAGIGQVVVRYWYVTRSQRYLSMVREMVAGVNRQYTVSPGLFMGMAGLGAFLLSVRRFECPADIQPVLNRVLGGVLRFALPYKKTIAFPAGPEYRICCDYASGASGIALFLKAFDDDSVQVLPFPDGLLLAG
jgi:serine/threonine protein kinase